MSVEEIIHVSSYFDVHFCVLNKVDKMIINEIDIKFDKGVT